VRCFMGCRRNRDCHAGRSFSGRRRGRSGVPSHNGAKQRARRSLLRYCRLRLRLAQICKSAWAAELRQAHDVVHCRGTCSKIAHGPSVCLATQVAPRCGVRPIRWCWCGVREHEDPAQEVVSHDPRNVDQQRRDQRRCTLLSERCAPCERHTDGLGGIAQFAATHPKKMRGCSPHCSLSQTFVIGRPLMKSLTAVLALATFLVALGSVPAANAARRSVPRYDQYRAYRDPGGSWQCYPYCEGGTYEGRPVREWLKPDSW